MKKRDYYLILVGLFINHALYPKLALGQATGDVLDPHNDARATKLLQGIGSATMADGNSSPGANCTETIRLDTNPTPPISTYNQMQSGHCYAAGTAVVFDYYRKTHGSGSARTMNASPIHLASIYKSDPSVKITYNEAYTHGQYEGYDGTVAANIGGGDPVMLLGKLAKESSKLTFCTNQGVDKVFKDYMKEHFGEAFANRLSTENFMKYLERVYGSYYFYYVNDKTHKESLRYTRFENDLEKIHQDFESGNLAGDSTSVVAPTEGGVVCKHRNWLPSITKLMVHLGDIVKFDKAFKGNKSLTDFILDTINKKCPAAERISKVGNLPQPIHAKEESNGNKDALKRFISQHLCQSKQPLAIQACSKGFVSPPGSNNPKCSLYCGEGVAQPCIGTDHIMAIVGRRLVGGVTQYLIQNSWGSTCGNYPISVECNASDNGRFWVKEEDLLKQITTAVGMRNDLNSVLQ